MQRNRFFLIFSSVFIFLLFFLSPLDPDLGWHLRYGEYFAKTLHFLQTNTLTYYLPGYFWQNSYSLYQIIVYFIYKSFGLLGLNFAFSSLMTAAYYFLAKTYPRFVKTSFILFILISIFCWHIFFGGIRSQLFSFFFTTFTFYLLEKSDSNPRVLYFLPPVFLIWANVHGAFPFGLLIFLAFLLNKILRKEKNIYLTSTVFIISLVATLINPYGFGVYKEGLTHITYPLGNLIIEWLPPPLTYILIIIFSVIFTTISIFLSKSNKKIYFLVLISVFTILSFMSRRNIPYIALVIAESLLCIFQEKLVIFEKNQKVTEFSTVGIILGLLYVFTSVLPANYITSMNSDAYCFNRFVTYPCKAVQFLKESSIKNENIFANYEWGGYLEWVLPENKYFVDGRMPTWKTPENLSPYTVYLDVMQVQPGYEDTLDKYKTDILLIVPEGFLDRELKNNQSVWNEIYRDNISVIYSRKHI